MDPRWGRDGVERFERGLRNFIMAHGSVSFTEECAMLCGFRPNMYLDLSGYRSRGLDGGARMVRATVTRGINHKILFGTDWPVFRLQGDQRTFVDVVVEDEGPLSNRSDRCPRRSRPNPHT